MSVAVLSQAELAVWSDEGLAALMAASSPYCRAGHVRPSPDVRYPGSWWPSSAEKSGITPGGDEVLITYGGADIHAPAVGGELHRVGQQIQHNLPEAQAIGVKQADLGIDLEAQEDSWC